MKVAIFLSTLFTLGVASAHIPVTQSSTKMDANMDGSALAGNYRVKDECDGGLFKKPTSSGLAISRLTPATKMKMPELKQKVQSYLTLICEDKAAVNLK